MTTWTKSDLAHLTEKAFIWDAYVDYDHYCKYCAIVPVGEGVMYCDDCAGEITDYLFSVYSQQGAVDDEATMWLEQQSVDQGLY